MPLALLHITFKKLHCGFTARCSAIIAQSGQNGFMVALDVRVAGFKPHDKPKSHCHFRHANAVWYWVINGFDCSGARLQNKQFLNRMILNACDALGMRCGGCNKANACRDQANSVHLKSFILKYLSCNPIKSRAGLSSQIGGAYVTP